MNGVRARPRSGIRPGAASFRPHLTLANAVSTGTLLCGWIALHLAAHLIAAVTLILAAALCDGIDGPLARRAGRSGNFGADLDSLADLAAFVITPPTVMYAAALHRIPAGGIVLAAAWVVAGTWRLARFGTLGHGDTFAGCPVPVAAVTGCLVTILAAHRPVPVLAAAVLLPALMVSRLPFPTWAGLARAVRRR